MVKPYGIAFFEEPITQNDALQMAQMRRATGMALACGQNEGLIYRFRDLLLHEAVDYVQPNVVSGAGITQSVKIAGLAAAFNVPLANGGAWPYHNMHLQAGLANGGLVEMHYLAVELCQKIYRGLPEPKDGWLTLPDAPGLGFEPDRDAIRDHRRVERGLSESSPDSSETGGMPQNALRRRANSVKSGTPASSKQRTSKMKRSTDRILTTHVGSLIRPQPLQDFLRAKQAGKPFDQAPTTSA